VNDIDLKFKYKPIYSNHFTWALVYLGLENCQSRCIFDGRNLSHPQILQLGIISLILLLTLLLRPKGAIYTAIK